MSFDFIYKNAFTLSFVYLLAYGLIDYLMNIRSKQLSIVLVLINAVLVFSFIMNMLSYKPEYKDEPGSEPTSPSAPSEPTVPTVMNPLAPLVN